MRIGTCGLKLLLILAILSAPLAVVSQPRKIGFLSVSPPPQTGGTYPYLEGFRQGLRERGWVEGQNVGMEYRWGADRRESAADLARELVRLNVDVIVTYGNQPPHAIKDVVKTVPIVALVVRPVGDIVTSLAHPSGNITGTTCMSSELTPKKLELLWRRCRAPGDSPCYTTPPIRGHGSESSSRRRLRVGGSSAVDHRSHNVRGISRRARLHRKFPPGCVVCVPRPAHRSVCPSDPKHELERSGLVNGDIDRLDALQDFVRLPCAPIAEVANDRPIGHQSNVFYRAVAFGPFRPTRPSGVIEARLVINSRVVASAADINRDVHAALGKLYAHTPEARVIRAET